MEQEKILPNFLNEYNKYIMSKVINKYYNIEDLRTSAEQVNKLFSFANLKIDGNDQEFIESIMEFIEKYTNKNEQTKFFKI